MFICRCSKLMYYVAPKNLITFFFSVGGVHSGVNGEQWGCLSQSTPHWSMSSKNLQLSTTGEPVPVHFSGADLKHLRDTGLPSSWFSKLTSVWKLQKSKLKRIHHINSYSCSALDLAVFTPHQFLLTACTLAGCTNSSWVTLFTAQLPPSHVDAPVLTVLDSRTIYVQ